MKHFALGLSLLLCLFLVGCSSGKKVVGKWKVSAADMKSDPKDPGSQMALKMAESITLDLKEDKTFTLTMIMPFEGNWTQSGDTVTLNMTKVMGQDVTKSSQADSNKPLVLTISSDGSKLTGKDPAGKQDLVFVRA